MGGGQPAAGGVAQAPAGLLTQLQWRVRSGQVQGEGLLRHGVPAAGHLGQVVPDFLILNLVMGNERQRLDGFLQNGLHRLKSLLGGLHVARISQTAGHVEVGQAFADPGRLPDVLEQALPVGVGPVIA